MPDADAKRFMGGLNQTKPGLRLRLAIHEGRIAISQVKAYLEIPGPTHQRALESWRRAWIRASETASRCIDELWETHHWPPDAGRERAFEYRPISRRRSPPPRR